MLAECRIIPLRVALSFFPTKSGPLLHSARLMGTESKMTWSEGVLAILFLSALVILLMRFSDTDRKP